MKDGCGRPVVTVSSFVSTTRMFFELPHLFWSCSLTIVLLNVSNIYHIVFRSMTFSVPTLPDVIICLLVSDTMTRHASYTPLESSASVADILTATSSHFFFDAVSEKISQSDTRMNLSSLSASTAI